MASKRGERSFRPWHKLRKGCEFQAVFRFRGRVRTATFTLHFAPGKNSHDRLGLAVSKKAGGAVERNKIKRRFREVFRRNRTAEGPWIDIVARPEKSIAELPFAILESEWKQAVDTARKRLSRSQK